jgi:transcriptional regulator with XRE-family HTH domain
VESLIYSGRVPTRKTTGPSALVRAVLQQLEQLQGRREITQKAMMRAAGSTQQAWSRWSQGAEPGLNTLQAVANALDAELEVRVRDRRTSESAKPPAVVALHRGTHEIELVHYFGELPETKREGIVKWVKSLAEAYLATQAKKRATRAK